MIPVRGYTGCKVAVLGLGRSGLTAARALRAGGAEPIVWDDNEKSRIAADAEDFVILDLNKNSSWQDIVCLIVSPGIPHLYPAPHPIVLKAWQNGVVVDNDIGLFFRSFATQEWDNFDVMPKVICVTGSNGKSTTTALIAHLLEGSNRKVVVAGNIGRGVLDIPPAQDGTIVVLELSSYQIDLARALAPDIAVFINLSPDHLDRHNGLGGYFYAKRRLFIDGNPDRAIIGVDEIEGQFLENQLRQDAKSGDPVISVSVNRKLQNNGWSVFSRKGFLAEWRKGRQVASIDLRSMSGLPGEHNHQNACCAYAVCRSIGLAPKLIEEKLNSYVGLTHRCQTVGTFNGVMYVNDSKATNVDAAKKALLAFKNILWIVGGESKEGGVLPLKPYFNRIKKAYVIGTDVSDLIKDLSSIDFVIAGSISEAVRLASLDAEKNDVVLLAPACASFDQYENFEKRGDDFINNVMLVNRD
ncbi:MAG: UDP-N-acetylmuramoyl-L-alanine--D-glutamate ligase [Rhodobacterales bacterium]|nr:UDP-N-acetylmuramoyl-L-alanine--D-glutamate ligase [Rhodobacterales bacterium]